MRNIILEALEEVKRLNLETSGIAALKEMVDSLTERKLADAAKIDELDKHISLKEKSLKELRDQLSAFNEISIENEALKRQMKRLTDENDDLLSQMQSFDSKSQENVVGVSDLSEQIEKINAELAEMSKQNDEKARENKSLQAMMDNNSSKIKKLIQENSELKEMLENRDDATPTDQVKVKYDRCIKKLKVYRETICEISEKFKLLKADREVLVETTKEYSESVSKWQKDIASASIKMIERIRENNEQLKLKNGEIDSLRKEIESQKVSVDVVDSNAALLENLKAELEKLKELIKTKDKMLSEERESQKKLKQAVKKTSLLDLEMASYEKTLDEINRKLEAKKVQVTELEGTVKMQGDTMSSLKSQIANLEANLDAEKSHSAEVKKNLDLQLNTLRITEHERTETNLQLELMNKNYEALKLENGEIKLEMSKHVGDLERRHQSLESEREELLRTVSQLEAEVDKFKRLSSGHELEIENLRSEFASYKIRAQGVLRQGQAKDLGKEQELLDEVSTLQRTIEVFKEKSLKQTDEIESLKRTVADLSEDKVRLQTRCKDLLETMERQSDEVLEQSRARSQQHEESMKAYQLQIDTINTFYKKKIQETEEKSVQAMSELKAKIARQEKPSRQSQVQTQQQISFEPNTYQMRNEDQNMSMLLVDREEAEGSEDQSSLSSTFNVQPRRKISRGRELMPLDELLNSSFDENLNEVNDETTSNFSSRSQTLEQTKAKLLKEENRVTHLTTLLADSEKDLARMQQMNDMLKEEVRRQQRNFDREEHVKNTEYLKNIVIKFVTLSNGDEKQRLIPVINTILKLSAEENNLLQNACKGGWGGIWSK